MWIKSRSQKRMFGPKSQHEKLFGMSLLVAAVLAGVLGLCAWWYKTRYYHSEPADGPTLSLENTSMDDESIPDASEVIGKTISKDFHMGKRYFVSLFAQENNYKIYRVDGTSGMTKRVLLTDSADKIIDLKDVNVTDRALVSGNSDCFLDNKPQPGIYALAEVGYMSTPSSVWKLEGGKLVEVNLPAVRCGVLEHNTPVNEEAEVSPPINNEPVKIKVPASDQRRQPRPLKQVRAPGRIEPQTNAPFAPAKHDFAPPTGLQVQDGQPIAELQHEQAQPSAERTGDKAPEEKPKGFFNQLVDGLKNHGTSEHGCSDGEKAMHVNGC